MPRSLRSGNLALDAGPLFTYLLLHFLDRTGMGKARRDALLRDCRGNDPAPFAETEQDAFRQLLKTHHALTTAYVITEVFRLREHALLRQHQAEFRRFALEPFTAGAIEEFPCSLRAMCAQTGLAELIYRLGPADTSVLYLGSTEQCLVLTDDGRMFEAFAPGTRFRIRLLREYLGTAP